MGIKLSGSLGSIGPIGIAALPKLQIGLDKLQIAMEKLQVGMDPLVVRLGLTEIPQIRVHMPTNHSVGLKIMGVEVLCLSLCGETQVITEPYVARPQERCGPPANTITPPHPGLRPGVITRI